MKYKSFIFDMCIKDDKLFALSRAKLLEMDFNKNMRLSKDPKRKIKILSNAITFDLSPDKKTFAVKNTSGHIAIYDYSTGEQILKNKCTNREGSQIYYINDHQIVSTDWDSKLIVFDINTNNWTLIHDFGVDKTKEYVSFVDSIYSISSNKYIISKGIGELYFIQLDGVNFEIKDKYCFEDLNLYRSGGYINKVASKIVNNILITTRYLTINDKKQFCVLFIDLETKKTKRVVNVSEILKQGEESFVLKALEITSDFKKLILGGSGRKVYVIDLETEKLIKEFEVEGGECTISRICSFFDDQKLLVGTWDELSFVDMDKISE